MRERRKGGRGGRKGGEEGRERRERRGEEGGRMEGGRERRKEGRKEGKEEGWEMFNKNKNPALRMWGKMWQGCFKVAHEDPVWRIFAMSLK